MHVENQCIYAMTKREREWQMKFIYWTVTKISKTKGSEGRVMSYSLGY